MLVTTHLMEEAERCDRLAIMNEGNLVALGTPAELKSEIGGDVILLDAAHDAGLLAEHIQRPLPRGSDGAWQSGAHRAAKAAIASFPTWSRRFPARFRRFR